MIEATATPAISGRSPIYRIALIAGRVVFGLIFAAAGIAKLVGTPMMVAEFGQIGFGLWFLYLTGVLEVAGAIMLIRETTACFGACLLAAVSLGAMVAQLSVLHQDVVHTVVFAALLACIAYGYRGAANKLFARL
jgi:uncharacterized membrane protein YphA (DoxX/SURF4 family)